MDKIISATDRRNHPQLSFSKLDTAFSERYSFSVISVNLVMELSIFFSFKFLLFGASQVDAEMNCVERIRAKLHYLKTPWF